MTMKSNTTLGCRRPQLIAGLAKTLGLLIGITTCTLALPAHAVPFEVTFTDGPSEGFNDPTLGAARKQALFALLNDLGDKLGGTVPVEVSASMDPLEISPNGAVIGQAGPATFFRDFTGAPVPQVWYPVGLANQLAGVDLAPDEPDVIAQFNSDLDDPTKWPQPWYYGLDANPGPNKLDFFTVAEHEVGHGIGFLSLISSDGSFSGGFPGIFDVFKANGSTAGATTATSLAQAQRAQLEISEALFFKGPNARSANGGGNPLLFAPSDYEQGSSGSHLDQDTFKNTPNRQMCPYYTTAVHSPGPVGLAVYQDIGWGTPTVVPNRPPVVGSATPSSGSSSLNVARNISVTYTDEDGAIDIGGVRLLVNNTASEANALCLTYNASLNKLYVLTQDGRGFLGGFAPGSNNVISNSRGSLNCAATTVSKVGNVLTVNWNVTPIAGLTGEQKLFGFAKDLDNATDGYDQIGTWTLPANVAPVNVSVTPGTGTTVAGASRVITSSFSDANGRVDLGGMRLLVNSSPTLANAFCVTYNNLDNKLFVIGDNGTSFLGGFAPGSNNVISNSRGTLNCAATTITRSGNNITINWSITPKVGLIGARNLYSWVRDNSGVAIGLEQKGTWTINSNAVPVAVSVTPSSGSSAVGTVRPLTGTFTDVNGVGNIQGVRVLVGSSTSLANAFCVTYNAEQNKLFVIADNGTTFLGGFAPGSNNVISNSRGTLNCAATTVTKSGNTLTVRWSVAPKAALVGNQTLFALAQDRGGLTSGLVNRGTWNVTSVAAAVKTEEANPESPSGQSF